VFTVEDQIILSPGHHINT